MTLNIRKTKSALSVDLNRHAKEIFLKYRNRFQFTLFGIVKNLDILTENELIKKISSQNALFNNTLKTLIKKANISKNISFHIARHTFAINSLNLGADIYSLSKTLGHKNITTTQIYLQYTDKMRSKFVSAWDGLEI
jgi:site-specific recombinase XerD